MSLNQLLLPLNYGWDVGWQQEVLSPDLEAVTGEEKQGSVPWGQA